MVQACRAFWLMQKVFAFPLNASVSVCFVQNWVSPQRTPGCLQPHDRPWLQLAGRRVITVFCCEVFYRPQKTRRVNRLFGQFREDPPAALRYRVAGGISPSGGLEKLCNPEMAGTLGVLGQRLAVKIGHGRIGPTLQQEPHDLQPPVDRREPERGGPIP